MDWLLFAQLMTASLDWHQTRYISAHPEMYSEVNPLMGRHPSAQRVNEVFLATEAAQLALAYALPEYRVAILGGSAAVHIVCVRHNAQVGIAVEF